jgi:hypothetical protein
VREATQDVKIHVEHDQERGGYQSLKAEGNKISRCKTDFKFAKNSHSFNKYVQNQIMSLGCQNHEKKMKRTSVSEDLDTDIYGSRTGKRKISSCRLGRNLSFNHTNVQN